MKIGGLSKRCFLKSRVVKNHVENLKKLVENEVTIQFITCN